MHLARVVGWKEGEKPTVADGLKIEALATGLQHPRSLYILPNGDVLVVQSKQPWPSRSTARRTWSWAGSSPGSLRGGDSRAEQPHHAAARRQRRRQARDAKRLPRSPQLALRRGAGRQRPLRRQYRCDRSLSLHDRRYEDHRARHRADAASGRPHRPPLDQKPGRKPGRVAALRRRRVEQQHHRERHRGGDEPCRHLGGRTGNRPLAHLRERPAQPERLDLRAGKRRAVDRGQRARRTWPQSRARLYDLGEGRRASTAGPTAITASISTRAYSRSVRS